MRVPSEKMASLLTEQRNPRTKTIDRMSTLEIVQTIHNEDYLAFQAVEPVQENIAQAVELVVDAFKAGGRLIYVGAGTSGRLGVLDATECPPTFGSDPELVQGIIAGGWEALRRSIERAEDSPEDAAQKIREKQVNLKDVVCGIAASSTTPFVHGAMQQAKELNANTIFVTCNVLGEKPDYIDVVIELLVGPEVVTGSTRMKAGTATKMVLNILTTAAMIRTGKVYENLMVDLNATCNKLEDRSLRMVKELTGLEAPAANHLIEKARGKVKTALVMHFRNVSYEEANHLLQNHEGKLYEIIR